MPGWQKLVTINCYNNWCYRKENHFQKDSSYWKLTWKVVIWHLSLCSLFTKYNIYDFWPKVQVILTHHWRNSLTKLTLMDQIVKMVEHWRLEWAICEFLGFETTLFLDIQPRKSMSKSIATKHICLYNCTFPKLYASKPWISLIAPLNKDSGWWIICHFRFAIFHHPFFRGRGRLLFS